MNVYKLKMNIFGMNLKTTVAVVRVEACWL